MIHGLISLCHVFNSCACMRTFLSRLLQCSYTNEVCANAVQSRKHWGPESDRKWCVLEGSARVGKVNLIIFLCSTQNKLTINLSFVSVLWCVPWRFDGVFRPAKAKRLTFGKESETVPPFSPLVSYQVGLFACIDQHGSCLHLLGQGAVATAHCPHII